ncbi:MAG: ABC transporter permease subunit [Clostridiaceae bacterium]|nr:ABC transporter permease subunit [Clostridiaceae bacterium]
MQAKTTMDQAAPRKPMPQTNLIHKSSKLRLWQKIAKDRYFLLMILPGVVWFFIFSYLPMGGIYIAFTDYFPGQSIFEAEFVGLAWFKDFISSYYFMRLMRNTFLISIYSILWGFPVPILFALVLNEMRNGPFKKTVQSVSYFPAFISTVVVVGILHNFLAPDGGIINLLISRLGMEPKYFMGDPKWFRTIYIASGIWAGFGFDSIIYVSAISGINPELYEAATIDGSDRLQKIRYVTLPSIMPTIIILLLLRLGSLFGVGYEKIIMMYTQSTYETADVISSFVYRKGLLETKFGFSTAVGLFNSVINFAILIIFNKISKKVTETSLW